MRVGSVGWRSMNPPNSPPSELIGVDITTLATPPANDTEGWQVYSRIICDAEGERSRFNEFNKLVEDDLKRINAQIEAALDLSRNMSEEQKKRVLD